MFFLSSRAFPPLRAVGHRRKVIAMAHSSITLQRREAQCVSGLRQFSLDETAVTAIEYGLLAALIAVGILGALTATGGAITNVFTYWSSAVLAAL
jgi:pilus assembly protein Flp/PilA